MPKLKTKRGAAKRFRVNGAGKVVRGKAFKRHNTGKKRAKTIRKLRKISLVEAADAPSVKRMIPYS